jgi:phage-related protein
MSDFLPPVIVELVASVEGFKAGIKSAEDSVGKFEKSSNASFSKLQKGAMTAGLVSGAALVGAGKMIIDAYNNVQQANTRLDQALKNTGNNTTAMKEKIAVAADGMAKYGYSGSEATTAIATMTQITGSSTKALNLMQTAANLAAYRHIDLSKAALMVARASEGNTRGLSQMGIQVNTTTVSLVTLTKDHQKLSDAQARYHLMLSAGAGLSRNHAKAMLELAAAHEKVSRAQQKLTADQNAGQTIIDALNKKTKGYADASAMTLNGAMQALGATVQNLFEGIAQQLTPAFEWFTKTVQTVTKYLAEHQSLMKTVAAVVGGVLVGALALATAMMISFAAAQIAATWEILAVIAAIAALTAGILWLWNNVSWFRDDVTAAWNDIKDVTVTVFNFIKDHISQVWEVIKVLFEMTPIGFVITHFNTLKDITVNVFNFVKTAIQDVWNWMADIFKLTPIGLVITNWNELVSVTKTVFNDVKNAIQVGINAVIGFASKVGESIAAAVKWYLSLPGKVLGVLKNAATWLFNTGKDMIQGLLDGAGSLLSKIGDFFLNKLPSWIQGPFKSALGIQSPSKVFHKHGQDILEGLIQGMNAKKDGVVKSVKDWSAVIDNSATPIINRFNQSVSSITDVSFQSWGTQAIASFDQIAASVKRFGSAIDAAKETGKQAISDFKALGSAIQTDITDAMNQAKTALQNAQQAFDQYKQSISQGITSGNQLSDSANNYVNALKAVSDAQKQLATDQAALVSDTAAGNSTTSDLSNIVSDQAALALAQQQQIGFLGFLQQGTNTATAFSQQIQNLVKAGASASVIQQITQLGAETGSKIVEQLLSGGKAAIQQANSLVETVQNVADQAGQVAAQTFYQGGIDAANAFINGISSMIDPLQKILDGIAAKLSAITGQNVKAPDLSSGSPASASDVASSMPTYQAGGQTLLANAMGLTIVLPGKAVGGPVLPNQSYVVGEKGPEVFTPSGAGNITPNHQVGNTFNVNLNSSADPHMVAREVAWLVKVGVH